MDQDAFRRLLSKPRQGSASTPTSRGSLLTGATASKSSDKKPAQDAFKPRNVKKPALDSKYRDRATERRLGVTNDYADVEAILDDFEKRTASLEDRSQVEEQRKYLGGDEKHTILVKGLDHSLLEQNKARAGESGDLDDALEQAFLASSSTSAPEAAAAPVVPQKRTREDIIRELKEKRQEGETPSPAPAQSAPEVSIEVAKKQGKFKPIGAPKEKEREEKEGEKKDRGEKRKKRKVVVEGQEGSKKKGKGKEVAVAESSTAVVPTLSTAKSEPAAKPPNPVLRPPPPPAQEEAPDEDFDIFADVGEYEGIDLGGSDDEDGAARRPDLDRAAEVASNDPPKKMNWFDDPPSPSPPPAVLPPVLQPKASAADDGVHADEDAGPMRLAPLEDSEIPSIRELLEMDAEAGKEQKRKARKEKNKNKAEGKKLTQESKLNRDLQKFNAYTQKKGGSSKS
ncbi:hypothetical protein BOTBODRAFT_28680 [Botryobasidium botryosum FD-172 SS1]|uniref:RED-like N-terminal domain-containing protein n=1 Tax=Botryobasidium botryosum (strain FD-172 SS1) TaxID=930990 RepID=A0A067N4X3_BOTB1|nr:hypothetical protein BOTBODRAFT_28680 [Botryobasidium botryosum FD-172 SS1]